MGGSRNRPFRARSFAALWLALTAGCATNRPHVDAALRAAAPAPPAAAYAVACPDLLDCQITGSPEMLIERRGVIFVSGEQSAADVCAPIFAAAVNKHVFVGEFGAATKLKTAAPASEVSLVVRGMVGELTTDIGSQLK